MESQILQRITPTPEEEERLRRAVGGLTAAVAQKARDLSISVEPMIVGSLAKGTHLPDPDIDLFVAFPPATPRDELKRCGLQLGEVLEERSTMYAEHPYTRGKFMGVDAEVVPCYKLEKATEKMSAVDRTPFHTEFVASRLDERLRADIRLLKQWTKGVGVYGAEARVQGFSGYLCELLVLAHGGFRQLLEVARTWKPGRTITLGTSPAREFVEALIVIDPVDPGRNVASAVSTEQLATFVLAASEYLAKPRLQYFFPNPLKPIPLPQLRTLSKKRGLYPIELLFPAPKVTEDVLYPQLWRARQQVIDLLHRSGFQVKDGMLRVSTETVGLILLMEIHQLPKVKGHQGPPPWVKNASDFLSKWTSERTLAGPYVRGEHIFVDVEREHVSAAQLLKAKAPRLSLGKNIDEAVAAGFKVNHGSTVIRFENRAVLSELLTKQLPWRR